jgi:drug/metabolite transporter (DMT)-like permease
MWSAIVNPVTVRRKPRAAGGGARTGRDGGRAPPGTHALTGDAKGASDWTAHLGLVGAAVLFGSTFVVVKAALHDASVPAFLAARFCIGALVLVPLAHRRRRPGRFRATLVAGVVCGAALGTGYLLQTAGLRSTSSSASAFLTYLLVVFVPLLSALVLRRPPTAPVVAGVVLATVGLVVMTGGVSSIGVGEVLTLGCALAFAVHVLLLAELAPRVDPVTVNCVQLGTVGLLFAAPGLVDGGYRFGWRAWLAAAFCGVAVSALGLGLQVWAQARVDASRASLLLMVEPVTAAAFGAVAGDRLGWGGAAGATLILVGILVCEIGGPRWEARRRTISAG